MRTIEEELGDLGEEGDYGHGQMGSKYEINCSNSS
jgi:hypothetical protein